jgi:hypothetical protein
MKKTKEKRYITKLNKFGKKYRNYLPNLQMKSPVSMAVKVKVKFYLCLSKYHAMSMKSEQNDTLWILLH